MNCKQGDLAIVVSFATHPEHNGKIVRCVRYKPYQSIDAWVIDPPLESRFPHSSDWAADRALRPIRDPGDDARDETLDWLPVPTKELA
jgi:hypothetical protein